MKFLKYALGILAVLIIGLLLLGLVTPKVDYEVTTAVDKPIAEAWAVSQDERKLSSWLEGFKKVEHVSGTPNTVGAVSNIHFDNDGEEMIIKETITAIEPGKAMAMRFDMGFMKMDYRMEMTSTGPSATTLTSKTSVSGDGMLSKSMVALMGGSMKAQEEANMAKLKDVIASNTDQY